MGTSIQIADARQRSSAPAHIWTGPLALWHLLSLDAPTVAALWTWFAARTLHVALPPAVPLAMFLAVWVLYAADRVLDTAQSDADAEPLEARHQFHRHHRRTFKVAIIAVSIALVPLIPAIPLPMLFSYLALGGVLLLWFVLIHLLARNASERLPKELIPGPFFAAAVFIPCLSAASPALLLTALCFALLCTLNCLYIYAWEHQSLPTDAHATTRLGVRLLTPLALACIAAPLALLNAAPAPILIAIASSAAFLFTLDRLRGRIERTNLRAAADLVLLTPLLLAPWLR